MANPLIDQGILNRLQASIVWDTFDNLNVTPSYLGDDGITVALEGDTTTFFKSLTGRVPSPEPFMPATITINLLKTQQLGNLYKAQMELNSLLGSCTVRSDSKVFGLYDFSNCAIQGVETLSFAGKTPNWVVRIGGTYNINSALWDLAI